jgi:hypothetical protein
MFKTLNSVFNTCHFIKIFKTLHVSASIGHPQVLKIVYQESQARKKRTRKKAEDRGTKGHEYLESQQFS